MEKGIAYGVGVGPGDPELMTLKAVRIIRENDIIALPGAVPEETAAYRIVVQAVPELPSKILLGLDLPMTRDPEALADARQKAAETIAAHLDWGRNVVFLTLGDSTIYSTFTYLQTLLQDMGHRTELVNGVPSFCAAAARLNVPLTEDRETLRVIPAWDEAAVNLREPGTYVLMKSGKHLARVKKESAAAGLSVQGVENCGMPGEKVYEEMEEIPENAGYFTLLIGKK